MLTLQEQVTLGETTPLEPLTDDQRVQVLAMSTYLEFVEVQGGVIKPEVCDRQEVAA